MAEETPPAQRSTSEQGAAAEDERRYALLRSIKKEGGADAFVQSISQQLLLQHDANWGDLLGAAPQALCFLGQCFVATTSSAAISSLQLPPESGLRERTLRANLLHCSDLGRRAFSDAQSKMDKVHMLTTHICEPKGPIDKVLRLLDDEELAKLDLQRQLDKLKKYSHDCVKDSAQVKERFAIWQHYATLIRRACTAAEDDVEGKKGKVQDKIVIAETRIAHQEGETKRTEQETASFRSHVDVHQDGYKKAQNDMPTGWNLIAQDAASKLINIWPDLISMARVARPWAMFAAGVQSDDDHGGASVTMQSAPEMPNPHDDYGFRVSKQISRQLHSLNKNLHHGDFEPPEYGIDWNSLYAFHSSRRLGGPPEGSIDVALGLFRQAWSQAPARLGQQSASTEEATDILEMIIDVCEEIYETKEAQMNFANAAQPRDKGMIRRWRETINSACDRIDILEKQLASAEIEHTDYMQNLKDSGSKRKKTKKGMSGLLNKNNVQIARENYLAAQKALAESEKLLAERVEREAQAKIKFNEVQLELAKLNNENMNMEEIKTVLKKCIDNLTHFLEHLDKLVFFFSSLYHFVDVIHDGPAQEFLAQVKNMVTIDGALVHGDQERRRARKQSLKEDLLVDALKLRGSYLVAGELASVYVDISKKHIMPGVNAVERLGLGSGEDSQMSPTQRISLILKSARKAQSEISAKAEKRRERLRDELYIQDREITEIGLMVDQAQLDDGEGSDYVNEWDEA